MIGAVLFDVDGVIVDSEELYRRGINETFAPYGVRLSREEYIERYMIRQTNSAGVIRDYGLDVDPVELRARRRGIISSLMQDELQMMPHALEMLERLGRYPMGVVSSANRSEVGLNLGKFGLMDRFCVVVTAEDAERSKPDPRPYMVGVARLGRHVPGLEAGDVLVVEDNPSGVISAKGAGCIVVAYPNGYTGGMDCSMADATVKSLRDIDDNLIARLFP